MSESLKPNLKEIYRMLDSAKYQVGTGSHQRWVIDFENVVVPLEDFEKQLKERLKVLENWNTREANAKRELLNQILGEEK